MMVLARYILEQSRPVDHRYILICDQSGRFALMFVPFDRTVTAPDVRLTR